MWEDLIAPKTTVGLPWLGGRSVTNGDRAWRVRGQLPPEYGWWRFVVDGGRGAVWAAEEGQAEPNVGFAAGTSAKRLQGYLVGDRFIRDDVQVDPDPDRLASQAPTVFLVPPGLDRFSRVSVLRLVGNLLFSEIAFLLGPEATVEVAYLDRQTSIAHIKGVPPALDLAFRWLTRERELQEQRQRREEQRRVEEEQQWQQEEQRRVVMRDIGTSAAARRTIALVDFDTAARAALALSNAELLDTKPSWAPGEMVVKFRFQNRRFECVCRRDTLRITEAGICLSVGGVQHDDKFTLESLPSVILEAVRRGLLVVTRHA